MSMETKIAIRAAVTRVGRSVLWLSMHWVGA